LTALPNGIQQAIARCFDRSHSIQSRISATLAQHHDVVAADLWALHKLIGTQVADLDATRAELAKAKRALEGAGWVDDGGAEWKPPLGPAPSPLLQTIDALRSELAAVARDRDELRLHLRNIDSALIEAGRPSARGRGDELERIRDLAGDRNSARLELAKVTAERDGTQVRLAKLLQGAKPVADYMSQFKDTLPQLSPTEKLLLHELSTAIAACDQAAKPAGGA
jgi:hypothetical protein